MGRPTTAMLTLGFMAVLTAAVPAMATAEPLHGNTMGGGMVGGGMGGSRVTPVHPSFAPNNSFAPHSFGRPFVQPPFARRPFARPFVTFASPYPAWTYPVSPLAYAGLPYDDGSGGYAPTPVPAYVPSPSYSPTSGSSLSVAPPPMPSVVEYPTGRYELRGDGFTVPYTWVWVPNPPPAPPASPSARPPANVPGGGPALASPEAPSSRRTVLYTWTDREGVVHWTDHVDDVPPELRSQVKQRRL